MDGVSRGGGGGEKIEMKGGIDGRPEAGGHLPAEITPYIETWGKVP